MTEALGDTRTFNDSHGTFNSIGGPIQANQACALGSVSNASRERTRIRGHPRRVRAPCGVCGELPDSCLQDGGAKERFRKKGALTAHAGARAES